jgi:hypothetical protein
MFTNLNKIVFKGSAPQMGKMVFKDVTITAYYSACDETWTEDVKLNYDGTITWIAMGHTYGDWVIDKNADCTTAGSKHRECKCGDIDTQELPALGHNWDKDYTVDKEASCTEDGQKSIHCGRCSATKDVTVIEAQGHEYTDAPDTTCNICGEERPIVNSEVQITDTGRTLSLSGVIYINQYVKLEGCEGIDLTQDAGLLIWKRVVTEDNALFGTEDVLQVGLQARGDEYVQQSHGIAAKEYGDTIYLRVYVKNGEDTYVYGPLKEYSVRAYCDNVFANPDRAGEKLVNTCAAMLHYGAAAQMNFNYKVDNLANEGIPYPPVEWNPEWIDTTAPFTTNIVASDKVIDTGRTLSLADLIVMNCYYKFTGNAKMAELLVWDGVSEELTADNVSYTVVLFLSMPILH